MKSNIKKNILSVAMLMAVNCSFAAHAESYTTQTTATTNIAVAEPASLKNMLNPAPGLISGQIGPNITLANGSVVSETPVQLAIKVSGDGNAHGENDAKNSFPIRVFVANHSNIEDKDDGALVTTDRRKLLSYTVIPTKSTMVAADKYKIAVDAYIYQS